MTERRVRPPSCSRRLLETTVWPFEAAAFWGLQPLLRTMGRGDEHPVLLLPGFAAGDRSTVPLRWVLRGQGYWAHAWQLGRNIGPTKRAVSGMRRRLEELHGKQGRRVSIVGQSLGGIYARMLARESPELVRQVITLGSPYRMVEGDRSSAQRYWRHVEHLHDGDLPLRSVAEHDRPALVVPATSIYSRSDGIARWQTCIDVVGPLAENIEVYGSHVGMGVNPAVVYAVLDRLGQPEDDRQPFRPPLPLRPWYRRSADWRGAA
ncbi:MAG: esterase/lipase family protein [Ilumatobacteraceae bacterium]